MRLKTNWTLMITKEQVILQKLYELEELMEDTFEDFKGLELTMLLKSIIDELEREITEENQDIL